MSLYAFKFIQRLLTPAPVNQPIAAGDRVDEALNKLQGQIDAGAGAVPSSYGNGQTFSVPENGQTLFSDEINMASGEWIEVEENAVLTEVN